MMLDAVMITQVVDEEDPVLGFTPGWVNALASHVRSLTVYCLKAGKHELRENVVLRTLPRGRVKRIRRLRKGLRADLRQRNIGVVFAHMCPRYAVVARSVVRRRCPIVLWYAHSARSLWLRLAHGISQLVLTPTVESCPIRSAKVKVVGHGIDTDKFVPSNRKESDRLVLLSAGRITPLKRYDLLIEGVARAVELSPEQKFTLRILGSPAVRSDERCLSRLRQIVREKHLEKIVEFHPAVPYTRVPLEYSQCDIFICTAVRHSIDKAPLEAMACGKVLLTSNRNFRSVLDGHADSLVTEDETPADLGRRIAKLARMQPSQRETLGRSLREIVVRDHNLSRLMKRVADAVGGL
jgi:glycosyltransferase involved in cell wall biosynthesis